MYFAKKALIVSKKPFYAKPIYLFIVLYCCKKKIE